MAKRYKVLQLFEKLEFIPELKIQATTLPPPCCRKRHRPDILTAAGKIIHACPPCGLQLCALDVSNQIRLIFGLPNNQ